MLKLYLRENFGQLCRKKECRIGPRNISQYLGKLKRVIDCLEGGEIK